MQNKFNIVWVLVGSFLATINGIFNYIRFSEKIELFVAKEEAQAQSAQLKEILNQLDNGILIARKISAIKLLSKYMNSKMNLLFGTGRNCLTFETRVFAAVKDKKGFKINQSPNPLQSLAEIIDDIESQDEEQ